MRISLSFYIFLLLIFNSCRKYPEDEGLSSQTVKARLTAHDWYYNAFIVNDHDSTISHLNKFTTAYSTNTRSIHFRVKKFASGTDGSTIVHYFDNNYTGDNQFSLRDNKRKIFIGIYNSPPGSKNFWVESDLEWNIRKLTKTDFIIEKEYNDNKYRLEFKN